MFDQYTGEPTIIASEEKRSLAVTAETGFTTTTTSSIERAPSATPCAIFAVLSVREWYVMRILTLTVGSSSGTTLVSPKHGLEVRKTMALTNNQKEEGKIVVI